MIFRTLALALAFVVWSPVLSAWPDVVILVRHAEKEAEPKDNPPLTMAGRERAAELAKVVEALTVRTPVRAIFTTDYTRTRETAAPLAAALRVTPTVTNEDPMARVRELQGGTVVMVGHSNTLPGLIQALGGGAGQTIGDAEFDHLYVIAAPGTSQAKLASLRYGK